MPGPIFSFIALLGFQSWLRISLLQVFLFFYFLRRREFRCCYPDWSAMVRSRLTATSASWVQAILLPQPPVFCVFYMGGITQLAAFCVWCLSFSTVFSGPVCAVNVAVFHYSSRLIGISALLCRVLSIPQLVNTVVASAFWQL